MDWLRWLYFALQLEQVLSGISVFSKGKHMSFYEDLKNEILLPVGLLMSLLVVMYVANQ